YLAAEQQMMNAKRLNKNEDVKKYTGQLDKIRKNFDRVFWTGTEYRDPAYKGETDDRANAMTVIAGLADKEKYPAIRKVLQKQKHASPYMEKYVLESLFMMGYENDALARLKERFTKMVENDQYSTLWEGWGIGAEGFGGGTINHAWSGGGLTMLSQYATGLNNLTTKNGKTYATICPQIGMLKWIKSSTPTINGDIKIELENAKDSLSMTVTIPANAEIQIVIPQKYVSDIKGLSTTFPDTKWELEKTSETYFADKPFTEGTWEIKVVK
ncbi:MAG: alpha-L-rhamnosidase C-terminal domain-containing protein, partial [Thermoguttaceae bacterium]